MTARKTTARKKTKLKRILLLATLLCVSFVFLFGILLYKQLTLPSASAMDAATSLGQSDIFTISVIVVDGFEANPVLVKNLHYFIVDRGDKLVYSYDIPVSLEIDVPGRFGNEEFSKILALGQVSGGDLHSGINLLNASIQKLFGYKVDAYILTDQTAQISFESILGGQFTFFDLTTQNISSLAKSTKTNMSLPQLYATYSFINSLPSSAFLEMPNTSYNNTQDIDKQIRDITINSNLALERKSLVVLNGTSMPGVAGIGARVAENMGARVIMVDNAARVYDKSMIITDSLDATAVRELANAYGIKTIVKKGDLGNFDENGVNRANIVLLFGLDVALTL